MGRARLYHSADEKAAANREKSKKHYEKNKRSINKKRRKEYTCRHQPDRAPKATPVASNMTAAPTNPLDTWMEGVERVRRSLGRVTGDAPQNYVETICASFLEHRDKDQIHEKIVRLSRFQNSIYRYENEVYTLVGVGPEYERATEVTKQVNMVLGWVEEIFCFAIVDFQEVKDRHRAKEFMYQAK